MNEDQQNVIPPFIRRLMPHATESELHDATEVLKRYATLVIEMYERSTNYQQEVDSHEMRS